MKKNKIRYAVVGLGHIAQTAVLPAFKNAKNSEISALVSDDEEKLRKLGRKYGVSRLLSYDEYDSLLKSGDVDAVYIALPNHLHRDYTLRAAKAGIHVLCEKPMALHAKDCERMIEACEKMGVKLMIAYRLHFEESNLKAIELARSGKLGELRYFDSCFSFIPKEGNIRMRSETGGGPTYDIGIYCINAARYLFQDEPIEVSATAVFSSEPDREEVEETVSATLRFPGDRIASMVFSFGAAEVSNFRLVGTEGDLFAQQPYQYTGEITHQITHNGKTREKTYEPRDQFGPELVYFSDCILKDRVPEPSGIEGLADIRIIDAVFRSIKSGKSVALGGHFQRTVRPGLRQEIDRPAIEEPTPIHVESPHKKKSA